MRDKTGTYVKFNARTLKEMAEAYAANSKQTRQVKCRNVDVLHTATAKSKRFIDLLS